MFFNVPVHRLTKCTFRNQIKNEKTQLLGGAEKRQISTSLRHIPELDNLSNTILLCSVGQRKERELKLGFCIMLSLKCVVMLVVYILTTSIFYRLCQQFKKLIHANGPPHLLPRVVNSGGTHRASGDCVHLFGTCSIYRRDQRNA